MSEYAYAIRQMQSEIDQLKKKVTELEFRLANDISANDVRDQGHAIRDLTIVLERVVNQVFPEQEKT